jgi:DNA-binding NarL/FixJ family response regulator
MIRVYVVEDHAILREGLNNLLALSEDVEIIGMAGSAEEALVALQTLQLDVLLLDIKLPNMDGVELIRRLRDSNRLPATLILTTFDDDALVFDGLRAGAKGYLLKDVNLLQLLTAIREIAKGGIYINPGVTDRLLRAKPSDRADPADREVMATIPTERELHVLRLMANGYSNREIARALAVGEGTIKNHVSSILAKLGVRDRTKAVLKALRIGLL